MWVHPINTREPNQVLNHLRLVSDSLQLVRMDASLLSLSNLRSALQSSEVVMGRLERTNNLHKSELRVDRTQPTMISRLNRECSCKAHLTLTCQHYSKSTKSLSQVMYSSKRDSRTVFAKARLPIISKCKNASSDYLNKHGIDSIKKIMSRITCCSNRSQVRKSS